MTDFKAHPFQRHGRNRDHFDIQIFGPHDDFGALRIRVCGLDAAPVASTEIRLPYRAACLLQLGVLLDDGDPQSGARLQDAQTRDLQIQVLVSRGLYQAAIVVWLIVRRWTR